MTTQLHGTIEASGVTIRVYIVDGKRILDAGDVAKLLAAWEQGAPFTATDADRIAHMIRHGAVR